MATSSPWTGTHRVDIGASLGKALKARKNGGEAGTSSPAPTAAPAKGRRSLPDREFYSMRYQHKPASIDPRKPGIIQFTTKEGSTTPSIIIEQASTQTNESIMFSGQEIVLNKLDCVLIYDEDTGTFTLEKLDGGLKLSPDRSLQSIMPREASPTSSTSPPGHAPPTRRKERDSNNEIDDEIAALVSDTNPGPRSQPRSSRPQKEEEEEDEEELPLLQQQRLQQEQRRKQREQQEREAARREQEKREQEKREEEKREQEKREEEKREQEKRELLRAKQQREQERRELEEQDRKRREKEAQDQREQLLREQEQRRLEQQQQEQQQRRYISTNKPKPKAAAKKKAGAAAVPVPLPSKPVAVLPSRPVQKRPAEQYPEVEELPSITGTRPTKVARTKTMQTAVSPPPSSSGGLALPGSSSSLSALAPEPVLPSYSAQAKPVAPVPPVPEVMDMEDDSDDSDEGDWDEVPVTTAAAAVSTPDPVSTDQISHLEDEIFGDFMEEENGGDLELDLADELERQLEEGLEVEEDDYDEDEADMEPVTPAAHGGPISLTQMLGGGSLPEPDTDDYSSTDEDSD